jgi:hypothetical protein
MTFNQTNRNAGDVNNVGVQLNQTPSFEAWWAQLVDVFGPLPEITAAKWYAEKAWDAATGRCLAIIKAHDPMDDYITDADGNETPVHASWHTQREIVMDRIRGGGVANGGGG